MQIPTKHILNAKYLLPKSRLILERSCHISNSRLYIKNFQPYVDPIFSVLQRYNKDPSGSKVNLGIGAYRDQNGNPYVLKIVKRVESEMLDDPLCNKEYLSITGNKGFISSSLKLIYGKDCEDVKSEKIKAVQTISGTGACRLALEFLRFQIDVPTFYVPKPTWPIHNSILKMIGAKKVEEFDYYDKGTKKLLFNSITSKLSNAPEGSVVILQGVGNNPTGTDLTPQEWGQLATIMKERQLIPVLDVAYTGLGSGNFDEDIKCVRIFNEMGVQNFVCISYSKNMGLYNERVGLLSFYTHSQKISSQIENCLELMIRNSYSNPPSHGSEIVRRILEDESKSFLWKSELSHIWTRISSMRKDLHSLLGELCPSEDWSYIIHQKGLFTLTHLTPKHIELLEKDHHIYMPLNGRINISALTSENIDYVARSITKVIKSSGN